MVEAVELAMSIVQLTGVLVPLLLGITRYYVNNQDRGQLENLPNRLVSGYVLYLFFTVFTAYTCASFIFILYGNSLLITAVIAYGAFLMLLFTPIPYMLNRRRIVCFCVLSSGFLLVFTLVVFIYTIFDGIISPTVIMVLPTA